MSNFYITTPIFYVNDKPHLGHAYTTIVADIVSRIARMFDKNVVFLTGTDEYGQKIQQSAKKKCVNVIDFVESNAKIFQDMMLALNISNNDFIRTTQKRHHDSVNYAIKQMWHEGVLYYGKYSGWYSLRDEAFFQESELTNNGKAPTGASVEWIEEESVFFALSKFEKKLLNFYKENPNFIVPSKLMKESINFVENGLVDLCVSRTHFDWGIPMPLMCNNTKSDNNFTKGDYVVYVWLDALFNYLSAIGYPNEKYKSFWPVNWHVIGKDILRFHSVYWPAFLMSIKLPLPNKLAVHGWWKKDGEKMSKSLGNVLDPFLIVSKYGTDYLRYFCARDMVFGQDGNFTDEAFKDRINSELKNKIGNFVQRTLILHIKIFGHLVVSVKKSDLDEIYSSNIMSCANSIRKKFSLVLDNFEYGDVLESINHLADMANKYLNDTKPWQEKNKEKVAVILYSCIELIRYLGVYLLPFVPESANKMLDQISISPTQRKFSFLSKEYSLGSNNRILLIKNLFPPVTLLED